MAKDTQSGSFDCILASISARISLRIVQSKVIATLTINKDATLLHAGNGGSDDSLIAFRATIQQMFERYTEPARRAIFYARANMLLQQDSCLDEIHILRGLMWPERFRAEVLFQLRQRLPHYSTGPERRTMVAAASPPTLPLAAHAKKVLFFAGEEANSMGDAWVDTDHLLLGILSVTDCVVAQELAKTGVVLESARLVVIENRVSRPNYGPITPLGQMRMPNVWLKSEWLWWIARRQEKKFIKQLQK
jgi:hypothetical protein